MARRRFSTRRIMTIGVLVIIAIGVLIVGLPTSTSAGDGVFFGLTEGIFPFTLVKNVNVLCVVDPKIDVISPTGQRMTFDDKSPQIIDLFTNFDITTLGAFSSGVDIELLDPKMQVKCDPQEVDVSINLVGGWTNTQWEIQDQNGNWVLVSSVTKSIPEITRSIKSTFVTIPDDIVSGQELEDKANIQNVASKNVKVRLTYSTNLEVTTSATGSLLNTGGLVTVATGYVKIIPEQPTDPTTSGTLVDIINVNPATGFCFTGSATLDCGTTSIEKVADGGTMDLTVTGQLDKWTSAEGIPFIRIFDPRGQQVGSDIRLTTARDLGNGNFEFSRINFDIARTITSSNIASNAGSWIIEMHSNDDIRKDTFNRPIIDRYVFKLQDLTHLVPEDPVPDPTCDAGEVLENGECVVKDSTPPSPEQCLTEEEYQTEADKLSDEELRLTKEFFDGLSNPNECQTLQKQAVDAEFESRGLTLDGETPTGVTETKTFINYISNFEPIGAESNEGCQDFGSVPESGVEATTLQLVSVGTKCDGFRWGSTELTPVVNFGSDATGIQIPDKSRVILSHTLFISKNNPYPASPTFQCNGQSETSIGSCSITNHDFENDGVGTVTLTADEITTVKEFTDQATNGDYQLSRIKLTESAIQDKIRNQDVTLQEGDKFSYLVLVYGKYDAVVNGDPVVGIIAPMTFTQTFNFKEGLIDKGECPDGQGFNNITFECEDIPDPTCANGESYNSFLNQCVPDDGGDPTTCDEIPMCSEGENLELTGEVDACGIETWECQPITTEAPQTCPLGEEKNEFGVCIPIPEGQNPCPDGEVRNKFLVCIPEDIGGDIGCPAGEIRNQEGVCQTIGSGGTGGEPDDNAGGNANQSVYCDLSNIQFAQCLAETFKQQGTGTITGTTTLIFAGMIILIIIIGIIAVIRRRRSGF